MLNKNNLNGTNPAPPQASISTTLIWGCRLGLVSLLVVYTVAGARFLPSTLRVIVHLWYTCGTSHPPTYFSIALASAGVISTTVIIVEKVCVEAAFACGAKACGGTKHLYAYTYMCMIEKLRPPII